MSFKEVMHINRLLLFYDLLYSIKLKINPKDYTLWGKKGANLAKLGYDEEALKAYKKVVKIKPDSYEAWGNKGVLLFYLGYYEEALNAYNKAVEINPEDGHLWVSKCIVLAKLGRQEEALAALKKAIDTNPEFFKSRILKLTNSPFYSILCKSNMPYKVEIKKTNPPYYKFERKRGTVFSFLFSFLIELPLYNILYSRKLKTNPEEHTLWIKKGIVLSKLNRDEEAIDAYNKALEINPNDYIAWGKKSDSLTYLCRYNEALNAYNKVLEIKPNDYRAWGQIGIVFQYLGHYEEALNAFNRSLEINPYVEKSWDRKRIVLAKLVRHEEALNAYKKVLEINPKYYGRSIPNIMTEAEIHKKAISIYIEDQLAAMSLIKSNISFLTNKEQAWKDLIHLKSEDVNEEIAEVITNVYIHLSNKEQAFQDLSKLIHSKDKSKRMRGVSAIGFAFPYIPDKDQAWRDIQKLTQDKNGSVRGWSACAIGFAFPYIPDKNQAWRDIQKLTQDKNGYVRGCSAIAIGSAFIDIQDKNQAWQYIQKLTKDKHPFVRARSAITLSRIFPHVSDKEQAWQYLFKLTKEEDREVKTTATLAIGFSFPHIPNKNLAQKVLRNLVQDSFNYSLYKYFIPYVLLLVHPLRNQKYPTRFHVRTAANYSLGRAAVFNATEAKNKEDFKKELGNAISHFKNSTEPINYRDFPGDFCHRFYKYYYKIVFLEEKPYKIKEELLSFIRELEFSERSESKEKLLDVLKNLSDALIEVQVLGEQNFETMKCDLNVYRQYCEHAIEIINTMEEKTPYAAKLIQKGLPIIEDRIKEQLNEIKELSEYLCKATNFTGTELGCKIRENAKSALEVANPIVIEQKVNYILSDFKIWSQSIIYENERDYIQGLIEDAVNSEITEKLLLIRTLLGRVLHFSNSSDEVMTKYKIDGSVVNIFEKESNFSQNIIIGSEKIEQTYQDLSTTIKGDVNIKGDGAIGEGASIDKKSIV